jgi:hypothetical protein
MANWTLDGFIGQLFKTIGRHVPPPPGLSSPAQWGTEERLIELFGRAGVSMRYRSPGYWLQVFGGYYGPVLKAFAALELTARAKLTHDLVALVEQFNRLSDSTMAVPSSYLEIVVTRPSG